MCVGLPTLWLDHIHPLRNLCHRHGEVDPLALGSPAAHVNAIDGRRRCGAGIIEGALGCLDSGLSSGVAVLDNLGCASCRCAVVGCSLFFWSRLRVALLQCCSFSAGPLYFSSVFMQLWSLLALGVLLQRRLRGLYQLLWLNRGVSVVRRW